MTYLIFNSITTYRVGMYMVHIFKDNLDIAPTFWGFGVTKGECTNKYNRRISVISRDVKNKKVKFV